MRVCTLLEPRREDLAATIDELGAVADAFEIRLDALKEPVDAKALRSLTPKPLIATCRRAQEGGTYAGPEHERLGLLESCIDAGFEFADVEGPTTLPVAEDRIVRSRHEPRATPSPSSIVRIVRELQRNGAVAKFASPVGSFGDVLNLLAAAHDLSQSDAPYALMGLGEFPRPLLPLWGSRFVYGGGRTNAPGQPPLREIAATLHHWGTPAAAPERFLVVGDPITHSLSPRMQNAAMRASGHPGTFGALRIPGSLELQMLLEAGPRLGLKGLSVTTPLKDAAFELCEERTPEADAAKAVNCIRITDQGPVGHNTDGLGARQVVDDLMPQQSGRVLLAGTGGAARAIASQLGGLSLTIAGRRDQNLRPLASRHQCAVEPLAVAATHLQDFDLLINATRTPEPFPLSDYHGALFDLHYETQLTPWETYAREHGLPNAGGRALLLEQGAAAFEYWTRRPAPTDAMRSALEGPTA